MYSEKLSWNLLTQGCEACTHSSFLNYILVNMSTIGVGILCVV